MTDYDIAHLTDDLLGLLDDMGEEKAVFVGHDWGDMIVWEMALMHPGRVEAVVGVSVPFIRWPMLPTQACEAISGGNFFYLLYFQEVGPAEKELGADPRSTMARVLWSVSGDAMGTEPHGLTTGRPRELRAQQGAVTVADDDALVLHRGRPRPGIFDNLALLDGMKDTLPDFRGTVLIPGAGHWIQQEKPEEFFAHHAFAGGHVAAPAPLLEPHRSFTNCSILSSG